MSIHFVKPIVELLPEIDGIVKQASVEEFSTQDKASTLYSYLELQYLTKVAYQIVDPEVKKTVEKAVELYGLSKQASLLGQEMIERSREVEEDLSPLVKMAESEFEAMTTGYRKAPDELAKKAELLYQNYPEYVTSELVHRYAGNMVLNKEAALAGLDARKTKTGEEGYEKVAGLISKLEPEQLTPETNSKLAKIVVELDKQAGLNLDFYQEVFITKEAAISVLQVKLANTKVPVEKLIKLGKDRISGAVGKDFAEAMGTDPVQIKQVAETLPLDLQRVLLRLTNAI